ncbi:MAG TPA: hypothetical protein VFS39_14750 [Nitrospira sp.]|nr:hypothetical protein [Nitrospira sp.]
MLYFVMIAALVRILVVVSLVLPAGVLGASGMAAAIENAVFTQFARHIIRQVHQDKAAFSQASTCLSWFYKGSKAVPSPPAQGIVWSPTAVLDPAKHCPRQYPGGMESARDDFARTQTLLSVSLTSYEFALVADHNDDHTYNATELRDLFASLSLDPTDISRSPLEILTNRFDHWYRIRNLEEVMKGMSLLYERGYRVTARDRAELDRVMK